MIKTKEELQQALTAHEEITELAELASVEKWYMDHPNPSSHHGSPSGLSGDGYLTIKDDIISMSIDTSCCGSWDSDSISMTVDEFLNTDWQKVHDDRWAAAKQRQEEEAAKKKAAAEKAELTAYKRLKEKFEGKDDV